MNRVAPWRWWIGSAPVDDARILSGKPLALIGSARDAILDWPAAVDPGRPVLDLRDGRPLPRAREVRHLYAGPPFPIAIATRAARVLDALGLAVQPYMVAAVPLSARPGDALTLLQMAVDQHATSRPLPLLRLGHRYRAVVERTWHDLAELRTAARLLAALIASGGNVTRAAEHSMISRQAFQRAMRRHLDDV